MTDVHSCSYYCERQECIKAQRDELRDRLAQPEQEPVGEMRESAIIAGTIVPVVEVDLPSGAKLYTAPPKRTEQPAQRKPLTIREIGAACGNFSDETIKVVRQIEAAHGIKGEA